MEYIEKESITKIEKVSMNINICVVKVQDVIKLQVKSISTEVTVIIFEAILLQNFFNLEPYTTRLWWTGASIQPANGSFLALFGFNIPHTYDRWDIENCLGEVDLDTVG